MLRSTHDKNIILAVPEDPLSAKSVHDGRAVYKYSFHPITKEVLYSYPGEFHADAIGRAGKTKKFDEYVRVIYDPNANTAGSRVWWAANFESQDPRAEKKSYDAQYEAYQFFKKNHPKLKWIFNITNADLSARSEQLEAKYFSPSRALTERRILLLMQKFNIA